MVLGSIQIITFGFLLELYPLGLYFLYLFGIDLPLYFQLAFLLLQALSE
jgi:hypothetical protein